MDDIIEVRGGYEALHRYFDGVGDEWVEVDCPQLARPHWMRSTRLITTVGLPDFFPKVTQRDAMVWWRAGCAEPIRDALWALQPLACRRRASRRTSLRASGIPQPRRLDDHHHEPDFEPTEVAGAMSQQAERPLGEVPKTGASDGSPGLFDQVRERAGASTTTIRTALAEIHGRLCARLAAFIEDAKLCAALGAYWPASRLLRVRRDLRAGQAHRQ